MDNGGDRNMMQMVKTNSTTCGYETYKLSYVGKYYLNKVRKDQERSTSFNKKNCKMT